MVEKKRSYKKEKSQLTASLIQQAKKKGYIRSSTIEDRFARYEPSDQEKEKIYAEFEANGIEVIYSEDTDDYILQFGGTLEDTETYDDDDMLIPEATSFSSSLTDPLQLYLNEIHKFPTLTYKETLAAINKIQSGDNDAREYLINCNLKFAFTVAVKYASTGFPILDLIQQANLGLMTAVDRYNPHRGTKFSTYAVFWIRSSILAYIKENYKIIRFPNSVLADISKIKAAKEKYYAEHYKMPTDTELSDLTGLCISRVKFIQVLDFDVLSTDEKVDEEDNEHTYIEFITDPDTEEDPHKDFHRAECRKSLSGFLCNLSEHERDILRLRYGIGEEDCSESRVRTLEEVGKALGISRERARQIETRAINKLRAMPGIMSLRYFLDI